MSPAVKRFTARLAATAGLLLLIALGIVGSARWWARWAIGAALRTADLPAFVFEVEDVSWGRLQLYGIRLDSGELAADRIDLRWTWRDVAARRLASAEVEGLDLHLRYGTDGWSFGALEPSADALRGSSGVATAGSLRDLARAIPLGRIAARDVRITIETPAGPVRGRAHVDLSFQPQVEGETAIDWSGPAETVGELEARIDSAGALRGRIHLDLDRSLLELWQGGDPQAWPGRLTLDAEGEGDLSSLRQGTPVDLAFAVDAHVGEPSPIAGSRLQGPLRVRWEPEQLLLSLPECVRLTLPRGAGSATAALDAPAAICLRTEPNAPVRVALAEAVRFDAPLAAGAPHLALRVGGPEGRRYRLVAPRLQLVVRADDGAPHGTLQLDGDALELPDVGLALRGVQVEGSWSTVQEATLDARFRVAELVDGASRFPVISGSGRFVASPRRIRFDADARDATGELRARIEGSHALATGGGQADLHFETLRFDPKRTALSSLARWWPQRLRVERGAIDVDARLRWGGPGFTAAADVSIADAAIAAPGLRIEGLEGELGLARLSPLTTRGVQELRFRGVEAGVRLGPGRLAYALEPDHVLRIEPSEAELAGGTLGVHGVLDLAGGPGQRLALRLSEVQLPALLAMAPVEGLQASGILSGEMQLAIEEGRPVLRGGVLRSTDGGRIQYRPDGSQPSDPAATDVAATVREILRDFRYELLDVTMEGWLDERAAVQAHLRGYNPTFQGGHPVHLTLNLSSEFGELVDAIPELRALLQRLAERESARSDAKRLH